MAARPCALILTRNLPPLIGGMERLVWHIVDELRADYCVHVVGPVGSRAHLPPHVTASEVPLKPLPWFFLRTQFSALGAALCLRPRIVLAGSGLTAPFAWLAARLTGARCIVYLHGLDIEAAQRLYRLLWRPFFRRCDRVLVNSRFTRGLAIEAGVPPERIRILHPGVEVPDTTDAARQRAAFRGHHGLDDTPLMLYVGRITARKGLAVFVREMLPQILAKQPEAKLVVIGNEPVHALNHISGEGQRVRDALKIHGLGGRVVFLSDIDDVQLHAAYFTADVLVFPVQDRPNDHEGFGMVAAEAAAHGLPAVAFAAGGVPDAVADGLSGRLIPAGDHSAFSQAASELLCAESRKYQRSCLSFAANFAWPAFGERLRSSVKFTENFHKPLDVGLGRNRGKNGD